MYEIPESFCCSLVVFFWSKQQLEKSYMFMRSCIVGYFFFSFGSTIVLLVSLFICVASLGVKNTLQNCTHQNQCKNIFISFWLDNRKWKYFEMFVQTHLSDDLIMTGHFSLILQNFTTGFCIYFQINFCNFFTLQY